LHSDPDQFDRKTAIAKVQPEVVAEADRINAHQGETGPEFIGEANHLPAVQENENE
jgi:hypothetical protein